MVVVLVIGNPMENDCVKHILPLTYKPKIKNVRNNKCTQTIRPLSDSRPKKIGDLVKFHGWSGKPYRSKWGWQTNYFKILDVFDIVFKKGNKHDIFLERTDGTYMSYQDMNLLAVQDGFNSFEDMLAYFQEQYNELFDMTFQVIRWRKNEKRI